MNKRITTITLIIISLSLLSLLLAACGNGQLFGPKPTSTPVVTGVQGKVYFADSKEPIPDVTILLNDPSSGKKNPDLTTAQTTTDAEGNYSFMNITPGAYVIGIKLVTKNPVGSIDFTENISEMLASFQGTSQDGSLTLTMVEPQIEVPAGKVVQEDFIVHK